jgi:hypothetical protein
MVPGMSRFASPSPVIKTELLHVIAGPPAPRTQPMCAETDRTVGFSSPMD